MGFYSSGAGFCTAFAGGIWGIALSDDDETDFAPQLDLSFDSFALGPSTATVRELPPSVQDDDDDWW